jgi:type II secretory pathway predicted ATPase ExeA
MYNSYFGFRESPFSVTPDPRFFYTNQVYLEAFATLRYGIEAKKGFIVITGEVGTGKTTLLRKLLHSLEDTVHSVFIFNTYLSFPELLQLTLHDLGLTPKNHSKVSMLQELNDYLIRQLKEGHTVSMLIDEAQNLSDGVLENLRLLSNLETDQEKLIQIVLMGQPELQAKLARPNLRQLKQRVALQCRLHPLKDNEVGPYIDFRLKAAGYEGKDLFHPDAVERIAYYSKGIPRVMNIICDNALLCAFAASQQTVSAGMIEEVAVDLGLRWEPSVAEADDASTVAAPEVEEKTAALQIPGEVLQHQATPLGKAGVGAFLVMLALIALASVIDSRELFSMAGQRLGLFKPTPNHGVVPVSQTGAASERLKAEADSNAQNQRIIIQQGATIHKIAADAYGRNTILGMDLIKEFNPQIANLNWVLPGQDLFLPPLTQETLLRKQTDGSYRFIVASFSNRAEADAYARVLGSNGYEVTITPRKVSNDLLLQRVQIEGLKNLQEAIKTWETGLSNEWFAFVGKPNGDERLTKADVAY